MSEDRLKTAVLGLDDRGRLLLEAASKMEYFSIEAVADKDTKLAESLAGEYKCKAYDDYRQLVIANQFDCLLVAAGLYSCSQYVKAAIKKKFNILKLPPLARNFEEALELVRLADEHDIRFGVANIGRFSPGYIALGEFLDKEPAEQFFLVTATCVTGKQPAESWQTDPKLAGGGILLHECYEIIDQIMCNFDTPQQVYCLQAGTAGDKRQRLYLAEDMAVVTMRFSDSFIGNLIASRTAAAGPGQMSLEIYGKDKIVTSSATDFTITDLSGKTIKQLHYDNDKQSCFTKLLENFALSILMPDKNKLCSTAGENLKDMALLESAYLSARTAMSEEPARVLQMAGLEPKNIYLRSNNKSVFDKLSQQ